MRTKKKATVLINKEELPEQMRKFAFATSRIKAIEAEIEIEKQSLVKKYGAKLLVLNQDRDDAVDALQAFAEHHRDELFTTKKSMDLSHGIIGFRKGTPKVDKDKKAKSWEEIIAEVKLIDEIFIRKSEEVDKEQIIAHRDDDEVMEKFEAIGIRVKQDDNFFVEAKVEELVN
jgi:phage host-nuclease inhibitor protein Gam